MLEELKSKSILVCTQRTSAAALIPNPPIPHNSHTPQHNYSPFFSILSLKMSLQVQPQTQPQPLMQQQQQPVQVYPTSVTYESPPHHSNGSFGSVFVVLAIIIVISAVACCLGRLCNRRGGHSHNQKHVKPQKKQQQQQNHHNFRPKEVDIEFGFDKRIAASKPNGAGAGAGRGIKPLPHHGDMRTFEMKLGHQGKIRPGP